MFEFYARVVQGHRALGLGPYYGGRMERAFAHRE
jgi:hypothetical protein